MTSETDHPGELQEEAAASAEFDQTIASPSIPAQDATPAADQRKPQAQKERERQAPPSLDPIGAGQPNSAIGNLDFILDVPLELTVELGRTKMMIHDLIKLAQGSVVELSKLAGETLDILANRRLIARGEVVVVNEKYGIRITEITSPFERVERLR